VLRAADLVPIRYRIDPVPGASGSRSRRWFSESFAVGVLRIADCVAVLVAGLLAYATRFPDGNYIGSPEIYALATGVLLVAQVFQVAGLYGTGRLVSVPERITSVIGAWAIVILVLIALGFITKTADEFSRLWAGIWFCYGIVGLLIARRLFKLQVRRWQRRGWFTRNVAIIGTGEICRRFIEHLEGTTDGSIRVLAFGAEPEQAEQHGHDHGHEDADRQEDTVRRAAVGSFLEPPPDRHPHPSAETKAR